MDLQTYIKDRAAAEALAERLRARRSSKTTVQYLWQVATGWRGRKASSDLARDIEIETQGVVSKGSLRPDLWGDEPPSGDSQAKAA